MFYYYKNTKGITLIELLLAMVLVGIVLSGLIAVYWSSSHAFDVETTRADVQYESRRAEGHIIDDVIGSDDVKVVDSDFNVINGGEGPGPALALLQGSENINYYLQDGGIYRDSSLASPELIASNIKEMTFTRSSNVLVNFKLVGTDDFVLETSCRSRVE